ncbi:5'-nucleotidase [Derxia gummosa]|uniref:5'-nucleotidase n=1 Tax=Derxia gummosa DSM 723 TaxID=1121388 RepID=A0A8B6X741_9BURK|nr:5'-nucleotidase [Derxia gummosa]
MTQLPTLAAPLPDASSRLVVAISSRALFDFEEENRMFDAHPDDGAYMQLQLDRLELAARDGVAAPLVRKLLAFNRGCDEKNRRVEVVILSRNDPVSGLRVFRSARAAGLAIDRAVFTRGRSPWRYLAPLAANLFLSANEADVRDALDAGFPAARVYPQSRAAAASHPDEIRIAFDGDAVLFSDEAEAIYKAGGLHRFIEHEVQHVSRPLPPGPFAPLLRALHALQSASTAGSAGAALEVRETGDGGGIRADLVRADGPPMRIRTALVTARSAPAHERAIRTLMDWNVGVDEAMFLGGLDKGPFLREFEPDFFFDDQTRHCDSAAAHAPTGHVVAGIANRLPAPE